MLKDVKVTKCSQN